MLLQKICFVSNKTIKNKILQNVLRRENEEKKFFCDTFSKNIVFYIFRYGVVVQGRLDVVAEWSKALDLGSSLHWRGFKSHRHHFLRCKCFSLPRTRAPTPYNFFLLCIRYIFLIAINIKKTRIMM